MRDVFFELPIITERLQLRPLRLGDAEAIHAAANFHTCIPC
jgi:hypothetical protein